RGICHEAVAGVGYRSNVLGPRLESHTPSVPPGGWKDPGDPFGPRAKAYISPPFSSSPPPIFHPKTRQKWRFLPKSRANHHPSFLLFEMNNPSLQGINRGLGTIGCAHFV